MIAEKRCNGLCWFQGLSVVRTELIHEDDLVCVFNVIPSCAVQ
jgi:hypothetical protein